MYIKNEIHYSEFSGIDFNLEKDGKNIFGNQLDNLPNNYDLRQQKNIYLSPVVNQNNCGFCWTIGTIQTLSDVFNIRDKTKINLSIKYSFNCFNENGCSGGNPVDLVNYLIKNGIPNQSCIRMNWNKDIEKGKCLCDSSQKYSFYYPNASYYVVGINDPKKYKDKIKSVKLWIKNKGPVIGGFIATKAFEESDGLFKKTNGIYFDNYPYVKNYDKIKGCHIISIVGWGQQSINGKNVSYWIVRNSWGVNWGDKGYFKMAMYPFNSKHAILLSTKSDLGGMILIQAGRIKKKNIIFFRGFTL